MYQEARRGKLADDVGLEARQVHVYDLELLQTDHHQNAEDDVSSNLIPNQNHNNLPCFGKRVDCGGGTYIRLLIHDIGKEMDSCATLTSLVRTK